WRGDIRPCRALADLPGDGSRKAVGAHAVDECYFSIALTKDFGSRSSAPWASPQNAAENKLTAVTNIFPGASSPINFSGGLWAFRLRQRPAIGSVSKEMAFIL